MDLQIRYCTAADGVSIAYTTWGAGSGKPHLIHIGAFPFSDLRLWETFTPVLHACLTRHWTVTTYDGRGTGRSQREVSDFSLDAMLRDLDAVIAAVGAARPSLMAHGFRAHVGLAYAADRPDRVERLIIDNGDETSMPRAEGFRALAAADWDLFLDAFASRSMSWSDTKSKNFADVLRANVTPAVALAYYQASVDINVSGRLPAIEAPTLILLPDSASTRPQSEVQRFVSAIPNAVLVSIDTDALWLPEDECVAAIEAFIGSTGDHHAPHAMGGTAVILFTDIADSTSLTERMGDAAFRAASRALDDGLRAAIRESGGSPVEGKLLGDGVMATFASAAQAIDAARRCVALSAESELRLHIGLHAGDVIGEGDNVYGGAVNIAARICGLCEPGEILVSQTVRDLARTSAGVAFEDRGEHALKGIEDAVRVFAVR